MIETNKVLNLLFSYTNICLLEGIMLRIVLIFNIYLTFIILYVCIVIFCTLAENIVIMIISPFKLNVFMFFKLPSAFWCGVRAKSISAEVCQATVKHRWFNKNPFNSMYFAVQAMAAEFTTGVLVMSQLKESGKNISMLVANNKSTFTKKATGRITFECNQGSLIKDVIQKAIDTNEGQTIWLTSIGIDEKGDQVSEMQFEWSVKVKG